jgi:hypothetical protein
MIAVTRKTAPMTPWALEAVKAVTVTAGAYTRPLLGST